MTKYPLVHDEFETLRLAQTKSVARFGDGELRLATNGGCVSQRADKSLAEELRTILARPGRCLVCIPRIFKGPKAHVWEKYVGENIVNLYTQPTYGSAFITRPDSAPEIDRPGYWDNVKKLWEGKQVTLVRGDHKSLTPDRLTGAREILNDIVGPSKHAWDSIDDIERRIGVPTAAGSVVILCLGATATVLAWRLAQKGVHALDLGHIGMFMRHRGAFEQLPTELISDEYRRLLQDKHAGERWGVDGHRHALRVETYARAIGAEDILDYGSGSGTLKAALAGLPVKVYEYDPGVLARSVGPKPAGLVVCTDVLEHVEPDKVDAVLGHICVLSGMGAYLTIHTGPANHTLPDGRNAHLTVQPAEWWLAKIYGLPWQVGRAIDAGKTLTVEIRK